MKWQKQIIWICAALILIEIALAYPECQRETPSNNIPCLIITSWNPGCTNYNLSIYNSSGENIENVTFQNYNIVCSALFNHTILDTYNYNSSIENGVITVVGENEMILALLLIPVAVMFAFIYWGNSLDERQEPLKWFFRLLALLMLIVIYGGANIAISLNPAYSSFLSVYDLTIVGTIFWLIMALMFIFIIYKIFAAFRQKKSDDILYGRL